MTTSTADEQGSGLDDVGRSAWRLVRLVWRVLHLHGRRALAAADLRRRHVVATSPRWFVVVFTAWLVAAAGVWVLMATWLLVLW
jgi:hypothetical protein